MEPLNRIKKKTFRLKINTSIQLETTNKAVIIAPDVLRHAEVEDL